MSEHRDLPDLDRADVAVTRRGPRRRGLGLAKLRILALVALVVALVAAVVTVSLEAAPGRTDLSGLASGIPLERGEDRDGRDVVAAWAYVDGREGAPPALVAGEHVERVDRVSRGVVDVLFSDGRGEKERVTLGRCAPLVTAYANGGGSHTTANFQKTPQDNRLRVLMFDEAGERLGQPFSIHLRCAEEAQGA